MLKLFIIFYMTLFSSLDMVAEKSTALNSSEFSIESNHLDNGMHSLEISSDCFGDCHCPNPDDCSDCHECHLGNCGFIISQTIFKQTNLSPRASFSEPQRLFSTDFNQVFRPPIQA